MSRRALPWIAVFVGVGGFVGGGLFFSWGESLRAHILSDRETSRSGAFRLDPRAWPRVSLRPQDGEDFSTDDAVCPESAPLRAHGGDEARELELRALALADVTGDGEADLLLLGRSHGHAVVVVRFGRAGRFCPGTVVDLGIGEPRDLAIADVTQDGRADGVVALADSVVWLSGWGSRSVFERQSVALEGTIRALALGDVTGDGVADILLAMDSPARLLVLVGEGAGRFARAQDLFVWPDRDRVVPVALRVADLNGDGVEDIVAAYRGEKRGGILWGLSSSERGRAWAHRFVDSAPADLRLGDFDADGRMDLALGDRTGGVRLFLGLPSGTWDEGRRWSVGGAVAALAPGHFDGDGHLDLAVALEGQSRGLLLMGDGRGGFEEEFEWELEGPVATIRAGRVNRDALDDLLLGMSDTGDVFVAVTEPPRIVVTTTADAIREDGRVSLREAILAANGVPPNRDVTGARGVPEVIAFNIPPEERRDGVFTIEVDGVLGPLPRLADGGTVIDGTTQPGWSGQPIVVLNGRRAGLADGITITSSLNVVAGLVIQGFEGSGIKIFVDPPESSTATGNVVRGCYIGTDAAGQRSVGNDLYGILITRNRTQANLIGGTSPADRNVISGNRSNGIELDFPTFGNLILGNYIGTDATGTRALPNGGAGIFISGARDNLIGGREPGAGNVISGNSGSGVHIVGVFGNQLQGNLIGTDASGMRAVPNGGDGVTLVGGAHSNLIGGEGASARNVISGNEQNGVRLVGAFSNQIAGNLIGVDVTGARALPNAGSGILVAGGSQNLIGGLEAGRGNRIAGNAGDGITVTRGAEATQIVGNLIGTSDREGTRRVPNGGNGIALRGARRTSIGGTTAEATNVIAFNARAGIVIVEGEEELSRGNRIWCNAFFANGGLGIDLGGDGVTPNDPGDGDDGPNALMNFPVVREVQEVPQGILLRGRLDTLKPAAARVDVYLADPNPTGFGEGRRCLVSGIAPNPDGTFEVLIAGLSLQDRVTLVATDESGNTSEFSFLAPPVDRTPPVVRVISPNGGEFVLAGTRVPIAWDSSDDVGILLHEVALSFDGGRTCSLLLARVGGEARGFVWDVPEGMVSSTARICVTARDFSDNATTDVSDGDFRIGPGDREEPVVRVLSPNGGEVARAGEPFEITWEASDNVGVASCDLLVSTDGGASFTPVALRLSGQVRAFVWNVPDGLSTTRGRVLVRCRDLGGNVGEDRSDGDFAVDGAPPTVGSVIVFDVNGPGRFFVARRPLTIAWAASDDVGIVRHRIEFSRDDGVTFEPLRDERGNIVGDNIPGDARQFTWVVPSTVFTRAGRFRVTAIDRAGRIAQALSERISIVN